MDKRGREGLDNVLTLIGRRKGRSKTLFGFRFWLVRGVQQSFLEFCLGIRLDEGYRSRTMVFLCDSGFFDDGTGVGPSLKSGQHDGGRRFLVFAKHSDECSSSF